VEDIALPVRYEAAQRRAGDRWVSMWRRRAAS
jgi:hypothetical protein